MCPSQASGPGKGRSFCSRFSSGRIWPALWPVDRWISVGHFHSSNNCLNSHNLNTIYLFYLHAAAEIAKASWRKEKTRRDARARGRNNNKTQQESIITIAQHHRHTSLPLLCKPTKQKHYFTMDMDNDGQPQEDQADFSSGPMSVLYKAVKGNTQVLVNVRNNHKLLGRVKAFDRHCNL
jgi:hypothetical protein